MTRAEHVNEELQVQLKEMKTLRDKYDDLKAEWMTLRQTNNEYKRTLADKVKEGFKYQKDFEIFKTKNELLIGELTLENDSRLRIITEL
jgi:vacuolar-type H+-ATPase subunit D/Vma8